MPVVRTLNQDFFKQWTPEMAYVLGFFAADGSMLTNKRGSCFIEFTSTDRILLEYIQAVTNSNHRISERPFRNARWKKQYRIQIGSKQWFSDLRLLGFTQAKSHSLSFPVVPTEYRGHFIRGYFDGDGCVYLRNLKFSDRNSRRWILQTLFTCGSYDFLISLRKVLRCEGIKGGSIRMKVRGFELLFSHTDSLALYRLLYHTAPTSNLFLPRKREKLERGINVLALDEKCGRSSTG